MKQIYYVFLCLSITHLQADLIKDIGKSLKKTTKKAEKGVKTAVKETGKGLETAGKQTSQAIVAANQETAKGLATAAKESDKGLQSAAAQTKTGLEITGKATAEGLETAGKETGNFFVEFGKSEIAPFVEPGKELKAFKTKKLEGAGKGKTINKGDTATWRIGTGCIVGVKAWMIEELKATAQEYAKMTEVDKKDTDIEVVINDYLLDGIKMSFFKKTPQEIWQEALKKNQSFTYRRYVGDWTVYEVTAKDNQCINHDFRVDYDSKTKKLDIKKTK